MSLIDSNHKELSIAKSIIDLSNWASYRYADYSNSRVTEIVLAVAKRASELSEVLARETVAETGMGVVNDKIVKNKRCSKGLIERYRGFDFVTPIIDKAAKTVSVPKPLGVVLSLIPETSPVASIYANVLMALMARCSIVICPHPDSKEVSLHAANELGMAAVAAGAPRGLITSIEEPLLPVLKRLANSAKVDLVLANGCENRLWTNAESPLSSQWEPFTSVPVVVDDSADLGLCAKRIISSKVFDNSLMSTSESVMVVLRSISDAFCLELEHIGAYIVSKEECSLIREAVITQGRVDSKFIGKEATWIAEYIGLKVPSDTKVLVVPFETVFPEERLAYGESCPILGLVIVEDFAQAIVTARAVVRLSELPQAAALHSNNQDHITRFASAISVSRIVLNAGSSLGITGFETNLPPVFTTTLGLGAASSVGDYLEPDHLVRWTRIAQNRDPLEKFPLLSEFDHSSNVSGSVPAYPLEETITPKGFQSRAKKESLPKKGVGDAVSGIPRSID